MGLLEAGLCLCSIPTLMFFKLGHYAHLYKQTSEKSKGVDQLQVKISFLDFFFCVCAMPYSLAHPIVTFFFSHQYVVWLLYYGIACSS